jgi:hypothetical protein
MGTDEPASERALRARMAAHLLHASRDSREVTAKAREAFLSRFERQVDPDGRLPEWERKRRAQHAMRAHMAGLALRSSKARKERRK